MRASTAAFTLLILVSEVMCLIQVKGFVGGGLLIKCKFDSKYKYKTKYFCRSEKCPFERLDQAVDSRYKELNVKDEGYYIFFIKRLVKADAGEYRCAVDENEEPTRVSITIKQDDCCTKPLVVTSPVRSHVDIPCRYPQQSLGNEKFFCKQGNVFTCNNLIATTPSRGRFSMTDDREQKTFTVRLANVSSTDYGVYWCGVRTGGSSDSVSLITEVQLQGPEAPVPPPPLANLPLLVGVCLSLTVLVLSIAVIIYLKNRHHKTKSTSSPANLALRTPRDQKQKLQACADSEYCEIKDAGHPPRPTAVENPADPSGPSDPAHESSYATVTFHKNPEHQGQASANNALQEEDACEYAAIKHRS